MSIESTLSKINQELISAFAELDSWFDHDEHLLRRKFSEHQWSAGEILEHVMLANHYLLILIEKGSQKARQLAKEKKLTEAMQDYCFDVPGMENIAVAGTFLWHRPDHMQPGGIKPLVEVRSELRDQLYRCLSQLDLLVRGEGILYHTQMSVNHLGKLDVYQYIYFLALHVRRHLRQLPERMQTITAVDWLI